VIPLECRCSERQMCEELAFGNVRLSEDDSCVKEVLSLLDATSLL
jgi:hypothetical protein